MPSHDHEKYSLTSTVHAYIRSLRNALNQALANRNPSSASNRNRNNAQQARFIRSILFTKALPFYGFHHTYSSYLKILLSDPSLLQPLATILRSGAVFGTKFEVYEAHLGYLLQFMVDFNLYGCGWLEIGEAWLRGHTDVEANHNHQGE